MAVEPHGLDASNADDPLVIGLSSNWVDVPGSAGTRVIGVTNSSSRPAVFFRLKL